MNFNARQLSSIACQRQIIHLGVEVAEHCVRTLVVNARVELRVGRRCFSARRGIAEERIDAVERVHLKDAVAPRRAIDGTLRIVSQRQHSIAKHAPVVEEAQPLAHIALFAAQADFRYGFPDRYFCEADHDRRSHLRRDANARARF